MAAGGGFGNGGESATKDDEDDGRRSSQSPVVHCSAGAATEGGVGFVALLFGFLLAVRLRRGR